MSPESDIPLDGGDDDIPAGLPNGTINIDSDDSDSGDSEDHEGGHGSDGYGGYQLLSQDVDPESQPTDVANSQNASGDSQVSLPSHLANLLPSQEVQPDLAARVSYTDTKAEQESRLETMAADEQIRTAMTGITLPPTNIPPWANTLDEDDWKKMLSNMVKGGQTKSRDSQQKNPKR